MGFSQHMPDHTNTSAVSPFDSADGSGRVSQTCLHLDFGWFGLKIQVGDGCVADHAVTLPYTLSITITLKLSSWPLSSMDGKRFPHLVVPYPQLGWLYPVKKKQRWWYNSVEASRRAGEAPRQHLEGKRIKKKRKYPNIHRYSYEANIKCLLNSYVTNNISDGSRLVISWVAMNDHPSNYW